MMNTEQLKNKILNGECVEELKKIPDKSFDLIFADPPYNLQIGEKLKRPDDSKVNGVDDKWDQFESFKHYDDFCKNWLSECKRILKDSGSIWVIGTYHNIYKLGFIVESLNLRIINSIIWYKRNAFPNITQRMFCESTEQMIWFVNNNKKKAKNWIFNYKAMKKLTENKKQMRNMWDIPMTPKKEKMIGKHPAQKPLEVLNRLILGCTKKKDIILDPFSGSGTTAVSAKINNRYYYAIENNNKYFNITKKRLKFANQS